MGIAILSAIIASVISSIINKNTIGTTEAYIGRWFSIFVVTAFILMCIMN